MECVLTLVLFQRGVSFNELHRHHQLNQAGVLLLNLANYQTDMLFHEENLPLHENGMMITAFDQSGNVIVDETYYSIGGGFIATADELKNGTKTQTVEVPFPFKNTDEMLQQADNSGMSLGA